MQINDDPMNFYLISGVHIGSNEKIWALFNSKVQIPPMLRFSALAVSQFFQHDILDSLTAKHLGLIVIHKWSNQKIASS